MVAWKRRRPFRLSFAADDSGSEYTGKYQGTSSFSFDNPLGFSDMFYASINRILEQGKPFGTKGHSFYYSLPVGYGQFSFNTNYYRYHQTVAGIASNYVYSGKSRGTNLEMSRVIYRRARSKTSLSFSGFVNVAKSVGLSIDLLSDIRPAHYALG